MKKTAENTVSVVHLIWLPFGPGIFNNFLSSYCKYNSGYPHELVLLFNGVSRDEELDEYISIIEKQKIPYQTLIHYGSCQDLDAYFWAANQLKSSHILFLNSYAEFLAEGWLEKYMELTKDDRVGLIGATGSWESYFRTTLFKYNWKWETRLSAMENIRKLKLLIKTNFYWRFLFPDFPNPHIRTNAFMIKRDVMNSLQHEPLKNKFAALRLESGKTGITAQILARGLEVLIVDKSGKGYKRQEWPGSNIFKIDHQRNLLVADNQTRIFAAADEKQKASLSFNAWGDSPKLSG